MFVAAVALLTGNRDRSNVRIQMNAHICHIDMYIEAHEELK